MFDLDLLSFYLPCYWRINRLMTTSNTFLIEMIALIIMMNLLLHILRSLNLSLMRIMYAIFSLIPIYFLYRLLYPSDIDHGLLLRVRRWCETSISLRTLSCILSWVQLIVLLKFLMPDILDWLSLRSSEIFIIRWFISCRLVLVLTRDSRHVFLENSLVESNFS